MTRAEWTRRYKAYFAGLAEWTNRVVLLVSSPLVKETYRSIMGGKDEWWYRNGEYHRHRPYPIGFSPGDPYLFYARGWGCSEWMFPHERWLLHRAAAIRTLTERAGDEDPEEIASSDLHCMRSDG